MKNAANGTQHNQQLQPLPMQGHGVAGQHHLVPVPGTCRESEHLVIVFPHAGGSPRQYTNWPRTFRKLAPKRDLIPMVLGATYPLRDHLPSDVRARDLQALAAELAREVLRVLEHLGVANQPERIAHVVLAGHSLGAIVAFEVLRELEPILPGNRLPILLVSGQVAPEQAGGGNLHRGSDKELLEELGRMDARTTEVLSDPEMAALHLPAIREDYRMIENYRCQSPWASVTDECVEKQRLNTEIVIVKGDSDSELADALVIGWSKWARDVRGPITVPGDHMHHIARNEVAYLSKIFACRKELHRIAKGKK